MAPTLPQRRALVVGLASLALFVALALDVVFHGQLTRVDEASGRAFLENEGLLRTAANVLALVGGTLVVAALVAFAIVALWWRGERRAAAHLALLALAGYGLVEGLKRLVGRARPPWALADASGYAFPSGHATFAALLGFAAAWFVTHRVEGRRATILAFALAVLWALVMAFSRLVLGVHYLSDVAGGLLLGTGLGCVGLALPGYVRRLN